MSMNILNDISAVYLQQIAEKKDDSYLETNKEALDPVGQEDDDIDNDDDSDASDRYLHNRRKAIGKAISKKKSVKEALDPVGQEDDDIDNDDDSDASDRYLRKRRKIIGKAISKKKDVKEGFSNWRQDLSEVMDDIEANKQIKEKKVNNKIKINPEMKEAVEELGGELIEMVEIDEEVLDEKAYRGLGVGRVERVSSGSYKAPETTGSAAKRKSKPVETKPVETKPVETKRPAALPPEQGRRARKRRAGSPSYDQVKAQIDAKEKSRKSRKPRRPRRNALDKLLASIRNEDFQLNEKATSEQQQKLFGLALSVKRGQTPRSQASDEVLKIVDSMSEKKIRDFAKTKHKGLPNKVEEQLEVIDEKNDAIEAKFKKAKTQYLLSKFRSEHPGSRQPKKDPGAKETPSEVQTRLANRQVSRVVKHGLTSKEKAETKARSKYDSPRD